MVSCLLENMDLRFWEFLNSKPISSFYAYDLVDHPEWNHKPEGSILKDGRWVPERPDGLTIGNKEVFAAIGIPDLTAEMVNEFYAGNGNYSYSINPSKMSFLVGPHKSFNHLRVLYNNIKYQDFHLTYKKEIVSKNIFGDHSKSFSNILSNFESKRLFRLRKTPITIGDIADINLQIKIIDFAPTLSNESDPPVVCRFVLIRNITDVILEDLQFGPIFVNYGSNWEFKLFNSTSDRIPFNLQVKSDKSHLNCFNLFSSPHNHYFTGEDPEDVVKSSFMQKCEELTFETDTFENIAIFGASSEKNNLNPGESLFIPYYFVLGTDSKEIENWKIQIEQWDPYEILIETYNHSIEWTNIVPIHTSSTHLNDAIDSILNLLKLQIGNDAIHTGSVYYEHDSAFVRDNYWIQRAFSKAGRISASKLNLDFFFRCWQTDGFRNSYNTYHKKGGVSAKEMRVEIPAYLPLMVRDLWLWTDDSELIYQHFSMVKDCINVCISAPNDLFIINSDETWIWPAFVNELDYYFDSSMVMIAGIHSAEKMAEFLDEQVIKEKWNLLRLKWTNALHKHYLNVKEKRYAVGIDHNGLQDLSLIPSVISRPILFGLLSRLDKDFSPVSIDADETNTNSNSISYPSDYVQNGLQLIWDVMHRHKTIRSHSRTSSFVGNTPGYYLYAVSNLDLPFKDDVLDSALSILDCTGSVYEIHDLYYGAWGTERRRIWDSAIILLGILEYLFGVNPEETSILFNPHNPHGNGYAIINDLPIKGDLYQIASISSDFYYDFDDLPENNDDLTQYPLKEIEFHFSPDEIIYSNFNITQVKIKRKSTQTYSLLFETDLAGAIRYYPAIDILEFGISHSTHRKPLVRIIENRISEEIRIEIDITSINEPFGICHESGLIFSIDWNTDTQFSCTVRNKSQMNCVFDIGGELNQVSKQDERVIEIERKNLGVFPESDIDGLNENNFEADSDLLKLNEIITWNGVPNVKIFYEPATVHQAIEILKEIAIIKAKIYPIGEIRNDQDLWDQCHGLNAIIVGSMALKTAILDQNFVIMKSYPDFDILSHPNHPSYRLIYILCQGDVYKDIHMFTEQLGIYLVPTRNKAMSMHPFGHFRLSDIIGMPANLPIPIELSASKTINFFIGGEHYFTDHLSLIWDPTKKSQGFKPIKPYCSFYTMQPYAEFEVAAAGIATGANCIRFVSEADADEPIEIEYRLQLDQTYHPIHLSGGQRERILDPTILKKNADGSKTLLISMHPGRPVHKIINPNEKEATKRSFTYVFGRYPSHNLF
jgi:hypothetical protein